MFGHYTHKGDRVLIEGRIDVSNYEDENGNRRTFTNVVAEQFDFIHNAKIPSSEEEEKKPAKKYNRRY